MVVSLKIKDIVTSITVSTSDRR